VVVVAETFTPHSEQTLLQSGAFDCLNLQQLHRLWPSALRALALCRAQQEARLANEDRAATGQRLAELTEHLQTSIEQERAAIAREIHDDIGGALAAVKFDLAWLSRHSADPAMLAHASAAAEMVQHALGASQRIMMNLRPAILDQGLVASVQWLATGFERRTGVRATVRASSDSIDTPRDVAMVAYRTAQEAMTNISKYAHCTQVRIELTDTEGVLTLEISDNGRGMASGDLQKPKAFGLKGLRERARTVGGWLDVGSQPGQGTAITLSVPLSRPSSVPSSGRPAVEASR
jgi:signal transduction histidine kinase